MIYVMSDIHGHSRRFQSILEQIDLQPEDTLYVLGDVIDRNPDGIRILRRLMSMPNVRLLLGNHELMMLESLYYYYAESEREKRLARWYRNGGAVTHQYLKHLRKSVRQELFRFLDGLPVNLWVTVDERRFLLTHAAVAEVYQRFPDRYESEKQFAVWYRYSPEHRMEGDYTVIFGHTPTKHFSPTLPMEVWYGDGLLGIDCGSAYSTPGSRLACLRLDDMKVFYSEENECALPDAPVEIRKKTPYNDKK